VFCVNLLDIAVLALFAFFLLSGWYRGFMNTLFSLVAYTISCGVALLARPLLENAVKHSADLYSAVLYYAEGAELVGDVELSRTAISSLSSEQISGVMEKAQLPLPMGARITENIAREAFAKDGLTTLGDYFNQTIVSVFINILCVLLLFVAVRLLLAFVIHMIDYARNGYPVLHTTDGLLGGCFGLIRGFLAMYILFMLAPIALIVLPSLIKYIDASYFGSFFYNSNFLLRLIPGT
jgi:uncharacterized membrane protein required for colicin V production